MEQLYLTVNFLFRDWHTDSGQLWAVVQPHVQEDADDATFPNLYSYIQATPDSSKSAFTLWRSGACDSRRFVPVPFPDGCTIGIKLSRDDNTALDSPETNDLANFLAITNPELFKDANREPFQKDRRWGHSVQGKAPPGDSESVQKLPLLAEGPFAHAYNKQLREAALALTNTQDSQANVRRLPAMLQLAFWGGSRRRLPLSCFEARSVNRNLMRLTEDEKIVTTNLHSLLGLTFLVATKERLEDAKNIANLEVEVNGNVIGPALPNNKVWKDLFGSLDKDIGDPTTKISLEIDETLKDRAYARQAFQSFEPIRNSTFFRATKSVGASRACEPGAKPVGWVAPTRFVARSVTHEASREDRKWQAYLQFEGTLERYRSAPVVERGSEAGRTILCFVPLPNSRKEFFTFFENNFAGANPEMIWKGAIFLINGENAKDHSAKVEALTICNNHQEKGDICWIGSYTLPWDSYGVRSEGAIAQPHQGSTLLFLGREPVPSRVLLLFPRGKPFITSFQSDDIETHIGEVPSRQSLGDRWELKANEGMPDAEFNVLRCISGDAKQIVPQLCFPRLLEFDFAQSAGAIEGKISVNYPAHVSNSYSTQNAILQELLNYNALIVLEGEQRQNVFGQILPYDTTMKSSTPADCSVPSAGGAQKFKFRFEPPTDAPPQYDVDEDALKVLPKAYSEFLPRDWSKTTVARAFFRRLFEGMSQPRVLSFGVEHTLGATLTPGAAMPLKASAYADFPVALPTDVVLRREHEQRSSDEDIPFLRVSYGSGPHPVTLHLHTVLLDDQRSGQDTSKRQEARIAACRAVAELAFAETIKIKSRIYHFDYRQAFRGPSAIGTVTTLGECIVSEDGPEWNCTELKQICYEWIYHNAQLPKEIPCSESTPLANHQNVLFVEFELRVQRDPKRVPPGDHDKHWKLIWRPKPLGRSEEADRSNDGFAYSEFEDYLSTLRVGCAVIPALRDAGKEKSAVDAAGIIGAGAGSAAGWIFREDLLTSTEEAEISAIICPLAFSPIVRDTILGDHTFEIVARYFERIDSLINSDPGWVTGDLAELRKNFERRVLITSRPGTSGTANSKPQTTLWHVVTAAIGKLYPVTKLGDQVTGITKANDALAPDIQEQVSRLLWSSPRLFGDAKAFLYSLVQGGRVNNKVDLSSEFVFYRCAKAANGVPKGLIDNHPQPFLNAFQTSPEDHNLRFLEVLDERRYGDVFKISAVEWKGIRRMLSEGANVNAGTAKEVGVWDPLPRDHILLPGSPHVDRDKPVSARADSLIHLPSREPVVAPSHIFSGYFDELQVVTAEYATVDLTALAQGKWKQGSAGNGCASVTPLSPRLRRSENITKSRPDESFFSMLYWIAGDEESQKKATSLAEVFQSFQNDQFLLFERKDAWPSGHSDVAAEDSVFRNLLNTEDEEDLPAVLESSNLERLIKVLSAQATQAPNRPEGVPRLIFKFTLDKKGTPVALCRFPQEQRHPWRSLTRDDNFEISVLRHCSDASMSGVRQRLLLLITAKLDLWTPKAFRLVLQRNVEHFDEHFAQEVVAGGSPYTAQTSVHRDYSDREPVAVNWRSNSVSGLARDVLLPLCFPKAPEPKWSDYDLSVTVRRVHKVAWMVSGSDGKETLMMKDMVRVGGTASTSSFPLVNYKYFKGQAKADRERQVCWFEDGTNEFFVDWLWSSETNLPFLRLSGLRVNIARDSATCEIERR